MVLDCSTITSATAMPQMTANTADKILLVCDFVNTANMRKTTVIAVNTPIRISLLNMFETMLRGKEKNAAMTAGVLAASINSSLLNPLGMVELYPKFTPI